MPSATAEGRTNDSRRACVCTALRTRGGGEALTLSYLGMRSFLEGGHESARRHFEEGLDASRAAGDRIAAHQALLNLGTIALERRDCDRACGRLSEGLSLATEVRDILNAAYFVKALGQVAGLRGRSALAARLLGASETAFKATGSRLYRYVPDDELQNAVIKAARKDLGDKSFEEEWRRGFAMTLEHAIEEALETDAEYG